MIFPDRAVFIVLLLLCETSCPPQQQEQGLPAAGPGLANTDAKLHCCCCCCCCCSPVLLLLWFGHTHAHKSYASDLWVQGIHTMSRETPSRLSSKQALTSTVSQRQSADSENHNYLHTLKQGFTATPARCWAVLYGVGCPSVRAAKSVSL